MLSCVKVFVLFVLLFFVLLFVLPAYSVFIATPSVFCAFAAVSLATPVAFDVPAAFSFKIESIHHNWLHLKGLPLQIQGFVYHILR